ncbi:FAD-dependent monooxygenase [Streptomyces niger]|uniref:FAD-dependent monooxygenase n=1 Tax=Streptomyces niger TaxID=66373 RepID=UPI00069B3F64|nr:FAD-dependent monooxygenase [Streptomyces niger]
MDAALTRPVVIVGGGTTGLALALFLDRLRVPSVVLEARTADEVWSRPAGEGPDARTMEHLRRLGLAGQVRRRTGPGPDAPADTVWAARLGGPPLATLARPTTRQALHAVATAPATDPLPEPAHGTDGSAVARLLYERSCTRPGITLCYGWRLEWLTQGATHVEVTARNTVSGIARRWCAPYAVGCDGQDSAVRDRLGIHRYRLDGRGATGPHRGSCAVRLELPTFHDGVPADRRAGTYWTVGGDAVVRLEPLDGRGAFVLTGHSPAPGTTPSADAAPSAEAVRRALGIRLPVRVHGRPSWFPEAAVVAERFAAGRVFLAGGAAHAFPPDGGFGLDTGIDDAADLAWMLAGQVRGWGGPGLAAAYDLERRRVALRTGAVADELHRSLAAIGLPPTTDDSPAGAAARRRAGALLRTYGERSRALGVRLGARYDGSPLIASREAAPAAAPGTYLPSGVPGGRAPHLWLDARHGAGSALADRFGAGFTLLRLGPGPADAKPLQAAAQAQGMPLTVLDVAGPEARELYGRDLVLIRPDQHIAWRGNRLPIDPGDLVSRTTGRCATALPNDYGDLL